jgi:NhaP-type Na+/H+ or K+/H+ antiporter
LEINPAIFVTSVLALGIVAQWLAWRFRLPAIVLLLAFGFAVRFVYGPPNQFISNQLLLPLLSIAVGIILFEGGLNLRLRELRETGGVVLRLVTVGLVITGVLTAFGAHWILGFSVDMSALLGALLTVSGPTVILPLLRHVRPTRRIGSIVKWEGIVNDPIGAVSAALIFELIAYGSNGDLTMESLRLWSIALVIGLGVGGFVAFCLIQVLRHYLVPDFLQSPVVLTAVVVAFVVSNLIQAESGLITVTVLGVILANQRRVSLQHVMEFKEALGVLLLSMLFVVLASNVDVSWDVLKPIAWQCILFIAFLMLVVRPIAVFVSTFGAGLSWQERVLLAWLHPRGIVAAAVASLFALRLSNSAFADEAPQFVLVVFLVIVATVTIYGLTLGPLALRLGLSRQNPQGVLFAGASQVVCDIALAIKSEGFQVLLVDTNHRKIAAARMAGLPVCFASISSEFVHDDTDLGEIGRLMAVTPNDEVNTLACLAFAEQFGRAGVYQLAAPESTSERYEPNTSHRRGRTLFRKGVTFDVFQELWEKGAQVKRTLLSADFTYEDFRKRHGEKALVLFTVDEQGRLKIRTADDETVPKAGHKVIALVDKDSATAASSEQGTVA